ncbi:uncharacterized protein LOC132613424 [Lycium barbarum]|uniref:uncharacterized protein LOC132613424 n=1 Tax=Lycium barbarum TaxID=112863 RepID=UPI00293E8A67|nr:uncharacterized protein LOC132613424 [Lycium barbarum]
MQSWIFSAFDDLLDPKEPGRRYWTCPYYGVARSCDFYCWKDDEIDPRSKFVIPKLVRRIGELEASFEASAKVDDKPIMSTKSVESKIDMQSIEIEMDNFENKLRR